MSDVEALVKETAAKITALEQQLNEWSAELSELVESIGQGGDEADLVKALTEGLKALRLNVSSPVTVNVEPTPVHMHVAAAAAPVVEIHERTATKGWKIKFEYEGVTTNVPSGATLTRMT